MLKHIALIIASLLLSQKFSNQKGWLREHRMHYVYWIYIHVVNLDITVLRRLRDEM